MKLSGIKKIHLHPLFSQQELILINTIMLKQEKVISLSLYLDGGKETEHWTTHVTYQIKVNVNGAIFEADERFGMGCLARGSDGQMMQAFMMGKVGSVEPEVADIIWIKEALSWIDGHSWPNVGI